MQFSTKKNLFLAEALKLIHKKGFKATTMRDIAEYMNFDASNSYNFVKSKQEILEIFLFKTSHEFHDSINVILDSNYDVAEKLKLIIKSHIDIASQKPYEVALLVNEWRNLKEEKLTEFVDLRNIYEHKFSQLLKEGIDAGIFKKIDIDIATSVILASLRWFYDKYATDEKPMNALELERQIVDFVFGGILN